MTANVINAQNSGGNSILVDAAAQRALQGAEDYGNRLVQGATGAVTNTIDAILPSGELYVPGNKLCKKLVANSFR